jgi:hypothetical protein
MKTLLRRLIVVVCLVILLCILIAPWVWMVLMPAGVKPDASLLSEEERQAKAEARLEALGHYITWWYLPGFFLLTNFLLAFTHRACDTGTSPAPGLATLTGGPIWVLAAPFPWWVLLSLALSFPAIELGTVSLGWFLGNLLSDKLKTDLA